MKKIYGLAALAAAMTLASCSNNDEPNVVAGTGDTFSKSYIAVNINPANDDTRAAAGVTDPKEYAVSNVQFAIFNESGKLIAFTQKYNDFSWEDSSVEDIDKVSNNSQANNNAKVIEIEQDSELGKVGSVMAILNSPFNGIPSGLTAGQSDIDDVRKLVGDYMKVGENFVMTNSAHIESSNSVYATDFSGHVYETYLQAVNDPVDIYVERVAARVDLTDAESKCQSVTKDYNVDGETKSLKVEIDGVDFIYSTTQSYLVKDIETCKTITGSWFTEGTKRTHWADPIADEDIQGDYYNKVYFTSARSTTDGKHVVNATTQNFYINENVSENKTYVVITGKIKIGNATTAETIYQLHQGGKYYTENQAKVQTCYLLQLADKNYHYEATDGSTASINPADIAFVGAGEIKAANNSITGFDNECCGYLAVKTSKTEAGKSFKAYEGTSEITTNKVTIGGTEYVLFSTDYCANVWKDGNTYFYTTIAPEIDGTAKPGVIRNHLYNIEFSGLEGLGCPLFDPYLELVPRTPDTPTQDTDKWFFNARINILSWKVMTQQMSFKN